MASTESCWLRFSVEAARKKETTEQRFASRREKNFHFDRKKNIRPAESLKVH